MKEYYNKRVKVDFLPQGDQSDSYDDEEETNSPTSPSPERKKELDAKKKKKESKQKRKNLADKPKGDWNSYFWADDKKKASYVK